MVYYVEGLKFEGDSFDGGPAVLGGNIRPRTVKLDASVLVKSFEKNEEVKRYQHFYQRPLRSIIKKEILTSAETETIQPQTKDWWSDVESDAESDDSMVVHVGGPAAERTLSGKNTFPNRPPSPNPEDTFPNHPPRPTPEDMGDYGAVTTSITKWFFGPRTEAPPPVPETHNYRLIEEAEARMYIERNRVTKVHSTDSADSTVARKTTRRTKNAKVKPIADVWGSFNFTHGWNTE